MYSVHQTGNDDKTYENELDVWIIPLYNILVQKCISVLL